MHFYVDTAKAKRLNHYAIRQEFIPNEDKSVYKTILKGEKCLVFTNGTIGPGALKYNYKKSDAIKMLQKLIDELKENEPEEDDNGKELFEALKKITPSF